MKRLIVKIEMLKNTNRYQLLKTKQKKHASVKALVYPSNSVEICKPQCVGEGRRAGCEPNIITTPVFKE